jgi:glutamyl/glutaminyl-tRNA synthetase
MRSRIAPTPSGFLHIGNALNFVLTWLEIRKAGGSLRLRIDDLDAKRSRPEFIEDIFETLRWMRLDWDLGPRDPEDHQLHFSQHLRRGRYLEVLLHLLSRGSAYVCECSRQSLKSAPCRCSERNLPFDPSSSVVRVRGGEGRVALGDFVLWRREGIPAYQLVSLIDDLDIDIDLIVRGEDLRPSTEAQLYLASVLDDSFEAKRFLDVRVVYHDLISGPTGEKLSKSNRSTSLRELFRRDGPPDALYRELSRHLGFREPHDSIASMLSEIRASGAQPDQQ